MNPNRPTSDPKPFSPESAPPPEAHPLPDPNALIPKDNSSEDGKDVVQEASEESFPASDPPSFTPVTLLGPPDS